MAFYLRDQVCPYFAGAAGGADEHAYDFMYWSLMDRATERVPGCSTSAAASGNRSLRLQAQLGFPARNAALPVPSGTRDRVAQRQPAQPEIPLMVGTWKRPPLPVANLLGPVIARQIG